MKKLVLIAAVFVLLPAVAILAQVNYYVSTIGSDISGDGSQSNPWLTIEYAVNNVTNPTTAEIIINVSGDTFTLNSNTIDINRGFANLTIQGAGSGSTIVQAAEAEGTATSRVYHINYGEIVSIKDMTIRYGKTSGSYADGGGIKNSSSTLILTNCNIENNYSAQYGGAISNDISSTLTLSNCTIKNNSSSPHGGGIFNYTGSTLAATSCTISNNSSLIYGGGCYNQGTLELSNCTINDNTARQGGGIYLQGVSKLTNCTVMNNSSQMEGGGLNVRSTLTLTNCTLSYNTCNTSLSSYYGGGIYFYSSSNYVYIKNTILANNENSNGTHDDFYYYGGTVNDNGYNIVEYSSGYTFNENNNIIGEQANLNLSATLESNNTTNGTYTLKTTTGSVAINAGSSSGTNNGVAMPTLDQRGAERNGVTDIGAYEYWADDAPLPVELTSFSASVVNGKVVLTWSTATEVNNYGFEIFRFTQNTKWEKIGFVHGHGNSNSLKVYTFMDNTPPCGKIKYRLKQIDFNGVFEYSNDIETNNFLPTNFLLHQNYPNPFNPETAIEYTIPVNVKGETAKVVLKVYDLLGREVATLVDEFKQAGNYKVTFNVETGLGVSLPSGVYFYKLHSGIYSETKKLILIK